MKETVFQQQIIDLAHVFHWRVAHFRTVRIQRRNGSVHYATPVQADGAGFPDLILVRPPRVIAAELKTGTKPSDEQKQWLADFGATPVETFVWKPSDWDEITETLR